MTSEFEIIRAVIGISVLVFVGRLLATLFLRIKLPEVIGEITAGIIFGPYAIGGIIQVAGKPLIELSDITLAFAQIGGIIILFAAGLEFTFADFRAAGIPSFIVGGMGVIAPFFLGYGTSLLLGLDWVAAMLVGAALTATSIVITVRVLEEIGQHKSEEGRIMVNAAVIDDVLGLAVLAVVISVTLGGAVPSVNSLVIVTIKSMFIWFLLLISAVYLFPRMVNVIKPWSTSGTLEALSTGLCFGTAAIAFAFGLSPIVGAYAAGMALAGSRAIREVKLYIEKLKLIFGPLFFAVLGSYLNPASMLEVNVLFVVVILLVAIVSKVVGCGLPAMLFLKDKTKGYRVGLGMASRGEVGFIIIGLALTNNLFTPSMYSTMLLIILLTTIFSPIMLRRSFTQKSPKQLNDKNVNINHIVDSQFKSGNL